MGVRRGLTKGMAVVGAGALPFLAGVGPAGAELLERTASDSVQFSIGPGRSCTLSLTSTYRLNTETRDPADVDSELRLSNDTGCFDAGISFLLDVLYIADGTSSSHDIAASVRPGGFLVASLDVPRSSSSVQVNGHLTYSCGQPDPCIAQIFDVTPK
jgi:hypothetical protein